MEKNSELVEAAMVATFTRTAEEWVSNPLVVAIIKGDINEKCSILSHQKGC